MKMKQIVAGAALVAATVVSAPAFAAATGNVGAVSEYLFRGIEQSGGAALQGGLDYSHSTGLYAGTWASNTGGPAASGGTELDLYGGYSFKVGEVGLDFGAIYYVFSEDEEDLGGPGIEADFDYLEIYGKASYSYFALQYYYASDYLGDANEATAQAAGLDNEFGYLNLLANFPLSPTLTLGLQYGLSSGDGAKAAWGDEYEDYSITLTKALESGFSASFGIYDTSFEAGQGFGTVPGDDDSYKVVVGLKKTFDL